MKVTANTPGHCQSPAKIEGRENPSVFSLAGAGAGGGGGEGTATCRLETTFQVK